MARRVLGIAAAIVLVAGAAHAESAPAPEPSPTPAWSFGVSAYTYVVPDERDYVQPTITADRGWLHLEARYNYEALDAGSLWVGFNFSGGDVVAWEVVPMLGGVVGHTWGIAPGLKGALSWWKLELSTEDEYVVDTKNKDDSFFYSWSELALSPLEWCRVGIAGQRTHAYASERDVQRGFLAGASYRNFHLTTYVFDPDLPKPTVVVAVGVTF
ncbi:MAG TPA: hypothetical protein VGK30_05200 [Candidatus Binatia bacterium]